MIQKEVMEKNKNKALDEKWGGREERGEKEYILLFFKSHFQQQNFATSIFF